MATLKAALRQAREWRRLHDAAADGGVTIWMGEGRYQLHEPVTIRPEDAGSAESPTTVKAVPGEQPVLSGGARLTGWKKAGNVTGLPVRARGNVYVCDVPLFDGRAWTFRQLWVNGRKAMRARDVEGVGFHRITSWDKKSGTVGIPFEPYSKLPAMKAFLKTTGRTDGVRLETNFVRPGDLEMALHQMWAVSFLRVNAMRLSGQSLLVDFRQPEARIQSERPWPSPMTADSVRSPYYLSNAIEFLDSPGEWYLDVDARKAYYWPRPDEQMATSEVVAPALEQLLDVTGSLDHPVAYVQFEGITFSYTTWMRPSTCGHVPLQAGMYLLDAYRLKPPGTPENPNRGLDNQGFLGRQTAAVHLRNVRNTAFLRCRFEHLGGSGLDYEDGTLDDRVQGCLLADIGGNGIQCGRFNLPGMEAHLPYNPEDERELCRSLTLSNNLVTDVSNDDWGTEGIAAGYVRGIRIEHNEVCEVSYMGITVGWGWQKANNCMRDNVVKANYIHHYARHLYDVSGIYTLSVQPKTQVVENVVDSIYHPAYVHDPNHWFYLYTDEGSSFITVRDNWTPSAKFLQNANGPGCTWENNGPTVADSIRMRAGLEPEYRFLKSWTNR